MACYLCGRGLPGCSCKDYSPTIIETENEEIPKFMATGERKGPGRPLKSDDEIGSSAGRKRATQVTNKRREGQRICEWAGLANCGGGKHPIVGCINNQADNSHHGPDKNTSNNSDENVHDICATCHNRWHAENDKDYDSTIKHSPRPATPEELVMAIGGYYKSEDSGANRDSGEISG